MKSTQHVTGGEILLLPLEGFVKQLPRGDEGCRGQSSPGPMQRHPRRSMHGAVALGDSGTSCLSLPGFFISSSCGISCQRMWTMAAPYLGGRARMLQGAQQHGHHFITQGAIWRSLRPMVRSHQLWGMGCCMCRYLPWRDALEMEGPRPFLTLFFSNCRVCIWEVFDLDRPALPYHISPVSLCWFMTSEILV